MATYLQATYNTRGPIPQEVIEATELVLDDLQADEVRLELVAAPINPSDILTLTGRYGILPPLPAVGGMEGIAKVIALGHDVQHLSIGQHVLIPRGSGTWATHFQAKAAGISPLPETADPYQLSMLRVNPATASLLLSAFVDLAPGDWVIQNAANSAVGTYLIQLAKARGIRTINIVRRQSLIEQLRGMGADLVLVDEGNWMKEVRQHTKDQSVKLAIDAVSGEATNKLAQCLENGGTLVNYGVLSGEMMALNPSDMIFRDLTVKGFWLAHWFARSTREAQRQLYQELGGYIASGQLSTPIDQVFKIADIKEAVAYANSPGRKGKVLVTA